MFFTAGTLGPECKLRIFTLMVTAREKNTRNAKQAEYKSILCQEYMVKVLDTIVKVKLYERVKKKSCVSHKLSIFSLAQK